MHALVQISDCAHQIKNIVLCGIKVCCLVQAMNRSAFYGLNPYERHKALINEYLLTNPGGLKALKRDKSNDKRDIDVIRENHRFLWSEEEASTWGEQLAKKYYDKLFKEYCICDLSRYKENKVALRWRIEQEVVDGKGQFECGSLACKDREELTSWEVLFSYKEQGEKKSALIKLRLCPLCSKKLNYHHKRKEAKRGGSIKRPLTEAEAQEAASSSKLQKLDGEMAAAADKEAETSSKPVDEAEAWKETGGDQPVKSREMEFQEYLNELFI